MALVSNALLEKRAFRRSGFSCARPTFGPSSKVSPQSNSTLSTPISSSEWSAEGQMLQVRKRYLLGIVICGAAYLGIRWLYYNLQKPPRPPSEPNRSRQSKRVSRKSSQSMKSTSQLSLLGMDRTTTATSISSWTNQTSSLMFFDVEPNLHLFKIYQDQLAIVDSIPKPRGDRAIQLLCETQDEFLAKVSCLRNAFQDIIYDNENCSFFMECGREILKIFLANSPSDLENCLKAYEDLLSYVGDETNHPNIEREIATRKIPMLSFYDLAIDYIILESLDDLENPPSIVSSIVSNKWGPSKFRQSACQSAVSTALKYKRSQLKFVNGFFSHFYSVLDSLSPTLAWGFLGTDEELKFRCEFLRESLLGLCRDYFSFDCVRYTSYQDLKNDIMMVSRERYYDLTDKLLI